MFVAGHARARQLRRISWSHLPWTSALSHSSPWGSLHEQSPGRKPRGINVKERQYELVYCGLSTVYSGCDCRMLTRACLDRYACSDSLLSRTHVWASEQYACSEHQRRRGAIWHHCDAINSSALLSRRAGWPMGSPNVIQPYSLNSKWRYGAFGGGNDAIKGLNLLACAR